jgi:hypothetical protein
VSHGVNFTLWAPHYNCQQRRRATRSHE